MAESLCYGKVPVLTRTSSLPDAGGRFARCGPVDDRAALAEPLWHLIHGGGARAEAEALIRNVFRPATRADLARLVALSIDAFARASG